PTRTRKLAFPNFLISVGFTVDVVLYKKVNQEADDYNYSCNQVIDVEHVGKTVEQQELDQFSLCGVDLGRKHIFAAILAFNNNNTAETRLHLYQGVQRACEEIVNILVNGGRKYNKYRRIKKKRKNKEQRQEEGASARGHWHLKRLEYDPTKLPVVDYGTGIKVKDAAKFKGRRVGLTRVLYQSLKKKRQKGGDLMVDVDEFRTLRVSIIDLSPNMKSCSNINFNSIHACQSCGIVWNRDVNASKN
ncbi:hypothetical protein BDF14DRAFT_1710815, partial [Spinellus fusiger]